VIVNMHGRTTIKNDTVYSNPLKTKRMLYYFSIQFSPISEIVKLALPDSLHRNKELVNAIYRDGEFVVRKAENIFMNTMCRQCKVLNITNYSYHMF
jgi:hypothetical protein